MRDFSKIYLAALAGTVLLAMADVVRLVVAGNWPARPLWFAVQLIALALAVAAFLAAAGWLGARVHALAARRALDRWPGSMARALDFLLWVLLWFLVLYPSVGRIAADVVGRPGFQRLPGAGLIAPLVLPLLILAVVVLLMLLRLDSVRAETNASRRITAVDVLLALVTAGALYLDATYLTGYYDLYHFWLGAIALLATGYFVLRRLRSPARRNSVSRKRAPLFDLIMVAVAVLSVVTVVTVPTFAWPPHTEAALYDTNYVKRAAHFLRKHSDWDGDGFPRLFGGGDPDDNDASIHPMAVDIAGDGIDQDGDGSDRTTEEDELLRARLRADFGKRVRPHPPVRRVVLISVDALRADRIVARDATGAPLLPHIHALAMGGMVFERAYAPTGRTLPTLIALLAASNSAADSTRSFLPVLKELGTATAFATPEYVVGFVWPIRKQTTGFDEIVGAASDTGDFDILHWGLHLREPAAPATTDSALAVLARFRHRPAFLWIHYYDSHQWFDLKLDDLPSAAGDEERYDRVLQIVDAEVGRLLAEIERRGEREQTAILLTGDHGEGLGEHGIRFHAAYVWEPILRVPLILVAPGVAPGTVRGPTAILHLGPTIIDLLGGDWRTDDAASLSPLLDAEPAEMPPVFLSDTEQIGVVVGDWKLVFDRRERMFRLFDLSEDPGETRNLAGFEAARFQELRALLALHLERSPPLFEF